MHHHIRSLAVALLLTGASVSPSAAQSDTDLRDTDVVQSVYLRTLSVTPSAALVRDAQMAFDLAVRSYGATDGRTADMALNLGRALNGTGQHDASVPLLESALSLYDDRPGAALRRAATHYELGLAQAGAGNKEASVASLIKSYAVLEPNFRRLSADTSYVRDALQTVGGPEAVNAAMSEASKTPALNTTQPKPTLQIPPIYPPDESIANIDGWVLLDYRLWPNGSVRDVFVLAASPENVFDISAAMALMQWQFEPPVDASQHHQLNVAFSAR